MVDRNANILPESVSVCPEGGKGFCYRKRGTFDYRKIPLFYLFDGTGICETGIDETAHAQMV